MGVLRVLLALSVALSHYGVSHGFALAGGFAAVQMFYVISGFYMATILTEKYDPRRDLGIFYSNRFLRIYSVYFVCVPISLAAYAAIYHAGHGGWTHYLIETTRDIEWPGRLWLLFTAIFIFGQESTLFLKYADGGLVFTAGGPSGDYPIWYTMPVPQAWSISLELMFYCLVPFLIRNRTRTLIGIIAVTMVLRIAIYSAGYATDPWTSRFFPTELGLFVLGMVARRIYDAYIVEIGRKTQVAVVLIFLLVSCSVGWLSLFVSNYHLVIWPYYFSALFALPCLFHMTRHSKIDGYIGGFSYPLYMIHWVVMAFYDAFAADLHLPGSGTWERVVILVAAAFAISWIIVVAIEVPVDRYRQRRFATPT